MRKRHMSGDQVTLGGKRVQRKVQRQRAATQGRESTVKLKKGIEEKGRDKADRDSSIEGQKKTQVWSTLWGGKKKSRIVGRL